MKRRPTFARLLRDARKSAGLSVVDLCAATDLHRQAIYKLEDGTNQPSWATVQVIAHALELPTDFFVTTPRPSAKTMTKGE